jgi:tRNA dimethylallyltransferase
MDAILIAGPTASGKSGLAMRLAQRHGGAVVNADSMQVYDTLRVLTARPGPEDIARAPHHLYGHVSARRAYSVGEWSRDVDALLATLRGEGRLPVIVGGTGLYFHALTGGLSMIPPVPDEIRRHWRERLAAEGPAGLHGVLAGRDGAGAAMLEANDGQRIVRALEVLEATGRPIRDFQTGEGPKIVAPGRVRRIVLAPERARLNANIERRFATMMDEGAVAEVEALLALDLSPELPLAKAIGVREIGDYIRGAASRDSAIERASAATRRYAKRQMTWFRNRFDAGWERHEGPDSVN